MPAQLRISVRFLDGAFHGRGDGGEPEWPPSPLRLFQAIVAAAATGWADESRSEKDMAALSWLESQPPPTIVAASRAAIQPQGYKLYVPDNVGDLVAKMWERGMTEESIAGYRTDKFIRPTLLEAPATAKDQFPAVHYVWSETGGDEDVALPEEIRESLFAAVRSISRLGWGIDLVVANAAVEEVSETNSNLPGERWLPVESVGGTYLRVPVVGTLSDLKKRHAAFLGRIRHLDGDSEVFVPVPPLAVFRVVTYRRDNDLARQPFAVFALRKLDDSGFSAFDTKWRRLHLTGMLRHAASQSDFAKSLGWTEEKVNSFILGHDTTDASHPKPATKPARLVFIPLPSIEWRGNERGRTIGLIRRVLVTVSGGDGVHDLAEFSRIVRALEGRELGDEKTRKPAAFLRRQSDSDGAISSYLEESVSWTTVTPVVLPGYDDPRKLRHRLNASEEPISAAEKEQIVRKLENRIDRLLRKALYEAGMPESLVANANLEWSGSGFFPGADLPSRYSVPDQCRRYRRLHVRITWSELAPDGTLRPKKVKGPFCIGSGRFAGLGLFVPCD